MGIFLSAEAFELIAAIVAAVATALGGAAASGILEKIFQFSNASRPKEPIFDELTLSVSEFGSDRRRFNAAQNQVLRRLNDARTAKNKQQRSARWGKGAANSLVFGQYVVGGVMATSFMQKTLSPTVIGVFGILVVISSLIKQHYHPEINAQIASQKALQLEALIRQSEDRLVVIQTTTDANADDPHLVLELLERISAELSRITLNPAETTDSQSSTQKRLS